MILKRNICLIVFFIFLLLLVCQLNKMDDTNVSDVTYNLEGNILSSDKNFVTIQDNFNSIYTFKLANNGFKNGDFIVIEYSGILDKDKELQDCLVVNYSLSDLEKDEDGIPVIWKDGGIFSAYYKLAFEMLQKLSLKEKIGQLLLVRFPDEANTAIEDYYVGGFVFYEKDFQNKNSSDVKQMIKSLQNKSKIPLLTAVDEEGGNVVRVSSNNLLVPEKFLSPSALYAKNGFHAIEEDTINKSNILFNLGLNLNLAPVVDVAGSSDYIYERTLKENTNLTASYAKTVIEASKGTGVSYTLKHFPGYSNNTDTHFGSSSDNRSFNFIKINDLPPFKSGIEAGAEAVLVSHNIVTSIDSDNPASLSKSVHNILRNELAFSGIVMTDDLSMNALNSENNVVSRALLAGNDIVITSNYRESFEEIENAIESGDISVEQIDKLAFKVLAWKYYKHLLGNIK